MIIFISFSNYSVFYIVVIRHAGHSHLQKHRGWLQHLSPHIWGVCKVFNTSQRECQLCPKQKTSQKTTCRGTEG